MRWVYQVKTSSLIGRYSKTEAGQGKLFSLCEKNKTGFIMTHLNVKDAGFGVGNFCRVL
jgi:hypothetical protein